MLLPGYRYEEIKRKAVETIAKTDERAIPVDPIAMAGGLGIHVVAYQDLFAVGMNACFKKSKNGFKFLLDDGEGNETWYIYYNKDMPRGRVRFTILHEIGHIVLGHLQESDVAEAEANFFAKFAIAPPSLVHLIRPSDYIDVALAFDLSGEGAFYSWIYYQKWLNVTGSADYERALESMFTVRVGAGGESMERILRMKKGA